jgi:hypothetical protein
LLTGDREEKRGGTRNVAEEEEWEKQSQRIRKAFRKILVLICIQVFVKVEIREWEMINFTGMDVSQNSCRLNAMPSIPMSHLTHSASKYVI